MGLARTGELLEAARGAGGGLGAFNVVGLEHAEGIVAGAERVGGAVVLQVSERTVRFHADRLRPIADACLALARAAAVPVSVHLDHATAPELCEEAMALGLSSVMFDGSALDYEANVVATAAVVATGHRHGVAVEAELGEVGGKDGVHSPGARTDPGEAARYVEATGVDALAVAIGSSHAMLRKEAVLDFELLERLRCVLPVPLVLHGSSGVADGDLERAVRSGIVKVNVGTELNKAFTDACRTTIAPTEVVDPRRYLDAGRTAVAESVARVLRVIDRARRAPGPDETA